MLAASSSRSPLARRLWLPALLILALLAPAAARAASPSQQLAEADEALIGHYEAGKKLAVSKLPLVMLVSPGLVTAYRHGVKHVYPVPAQASVDLKACAHGMLGFYGVMQPVAAGERSAAQWGRVRAYRNLIARMPAMILADRYVPAKPAGEAARLLERLRKSTDEAIARGSETHAQLVHDERAVRATVQQVFLWAGRTYAQAFLKTLAQVRADSGDAAWRQAWAVVGTSPAATRDNLETAIMIKAMGRGALGHRLFLSQNSFTEEDLMAAVAGMYYDQTLSRTVFANAFRMWRDLFAPISVSLTGFSYYPMPATHP
jgi:hypothetical protein